MMSPSASSGSSLVGPAVVRAVAGLELCQRGSVLLAHRLQRDLGVPKRHSVVAMTEEFHDAHQAHAGVEQGRGIGVPLMPIAA